MFKTLIRVMCNKSAGIEWAYRTKLGIPRCIKCGSYHPAIK